MWIDFDDNWQKSSKMSSKSIFIISSYTVLKLVHFFKHRVKSAVATYAILSTIILSVTISSVHLSVPLYLYFLSKWEFSKTYSC